MMSERFLYEYSENSAMIRIIDTEKEEPNGWSMCNVAYTVKRLNEQQATIDKLDQENADLLGARIKAQEEWEKCTDKLKEKIVEQQATINELRKKLKKYEDKEFERTQMRGW